MAFIDTLGAKIDKYLKAMEQNGQCAKRIDLFRKDRIKLKEELKKLREKKSSPDLCGGFSVDGEFYRGIPLSDVNENEYKNNS